MWTGPSGRTFGQSPRESMDIRHQPARQIFIPLQLASRLVQDGIQRPLLRMRGHARPDQREGRQQLISRHVQRRLQLGRARVQVRFDAGPALLGVLRRESGEQFLRGGVPTSLPVIAPADGVSLVSYTYKATA